MASHLLNTVNAIVFIIISLISWILILSNVIQTFPTLTDSNYTRACSTTQSPRMECWFPLLLGLLSKFPFNSLSTCLPVLRQMRITFSLPFPGHEENICFFSWSLLSTIPGRGRGLSPSWPEAQAPCLSLPSPSPHPVSQEPCLRPSLSPAVALAMLNTPSSQAGHHPQATYHPGLPWRLSW